MNPEVENLINMAIAKGEITEKDKEIILQKAERVGENLDEIELIINGKSALLKKEQSSKDMPIEGDTKDLPKEIVQKGPELNRGVLLLFLISSLCMLITPFFSWNSMPGALISNNEDHTLRLAAIILACGAIGVLNNPKWGFLGPLLSFGVYYMYYHDFNLNGLASPNGIHLSNAFWIGLSSTIITFILVIVILFTSKPVESKA